MKQRKVNLSGIWFWMGLAAVGFMLLPFLLLDENAVVVYHDQLDGEILAYMMHAAGPFSKVLEGFMGGMSATALTPPAPLAVLLFMVMKPFAAYVSLQLIGSLAGYLGIWLMGRTMGAARPVVMLVGVLFAYLPFLPVYGLSQYGVPLVIWSFYQLYRRERRLPAVGYLLVYALMSSLVLAGFAVLGISGAFAFVWCCTLVRKKRPLGTAAGYVLTWIGMAAVYLVENAALILQMLRVDREAGVSHKAEYLLAAEPFFKSLWENLWLGGQHSEVLQKYILIAGVVTLVVFGVVKGTENKEQSWRKWKLLAVCLGMNFLLALFAALWNCKWGVALRSPLSALRGFQLDRVLWIAPAFWYLSLIVVWELWLDHIKKARLVGSLGVALLLGCTLLTGLTILKESCIKPNLQKLINPSYRAISFRDYYAADVMEQVRQFLTEETGLEPEEYRVVSLGVDPAAAYYAGFSCLDGYSNNYDLEYKHAFRQIIAPELAKSPYLTQYFDDWGNRCYLMSAECPGYYTIEKGGFYFQNYELNAGALYELGGRYLLSAAYIADAEEQGLTLLREEAFETTDSYYRIFVYEVTP